MRAPPEALLRASLWATAAANLGVALLVLLPQTLPGQLAGLPQEPAPALYRVLLAVFIALFGFTYAWLAHRRVVERSLLMLGATGKLLAFLGVSILWCVGDISGRFALLMIGDLLFAALFFAWLFGEPRCGT
ncbi:hypothetical protein DFR24_2997 [Panacagrimonas perspica]|uniref:Uncharacterized protein n=1 Tax=Panacagrimonas perspica TaxID=381431 RepID=A0A4R7P587_9GAMM|nr:hypothetical protein [Panacagrimonas perspica]TDU28622.1 hypothetical protein DFR24_2997 [Panacagrimonas perspica]THD04953.1 hypothetical protein B1810_03125 [Panacagrimonas perspica]